MGAVNFNRSGHLVRFGFLGWSGIVRRFDPRALSLIFPKPDSLNECESRRGMLLLEAIRTGFAATDAIVAAAETRHFITSDMSCCEV